MSLNVTRKMPSSYFILRFVRNAPTWKQVHLTVQLKSNVVDKNMVDRKHNAYFIVWLIVLNLWVDHFLFDRDSYIREFLQHTCWKYHPLGFSSLHWWWIQHVWRFYVSPDVDKPRMWTKIMWTDDTCWYVLIDEFGSIFDWIRNCGRTN